MTEGSGPFRWFVRTFTVQEGDTFWTGVFKGMLLANAIGWPIIGTLVVIHYV